MPDQIQAVSGGDPRIGELGRSGDHLLGQIIGIARGYLEQNPMYTFWPSLCLAVTVLAINLIGDRLRDILDPHTS